MIFRTFAERKRLESLAGEPEIYVYDEAPPQFRHQICSAFSDGIGPYTSVGPYDVSGLPREAIKANECWSRIDHVCFEEIFPYHEYATRVFPSERVVQALTAIKDIDIFLSIVEIGCVFLVETAQDTYLDTRKRQSLLGTISEINERFEQHAIGYQFENGKIIRKDSELIHAEIIKPTLSLLAEPIFEKINDEFMTAHEHYRHKNFKDAVTAANRAFETMLKVICDLNKWKYGKGDRVSELVTLVGKNGLFTHDFDKGISAYIAAMKTGLPTVRNDAGGHGEGLEDNAVTSEIARYAIDLAATNILFLGNCYSALARNKGAECYRLR
jgi:hypothetical protein